MNGVGNVKIALGSDAQQTNDGNNVANTNSNLNTAANSNTNSGINANTVTGNSTNNITSSNVTGGH